MATNYEFLVSGRIDLGRVEQQLEQMRQRYNTLDITVNLTNMDGIEQNFNRLTQNIQRNLTQVSGQISTTLNNNLDSQGIPFLRRNGNGEFMSSVNALGQALRNMNFDDGSINTITDSLNKMDISISRIRANINDDGGLTVSIRGLSDLDTAVTLTRNYDAAGNLLNETTRQIVRNFDDGSTAAKKFNSDLEKAQSAITEGKMTVSLSGVTSQYKQLISTGNDGLPQLAQNLQRLEEIRNEMSLGNISDERMVELYREFNTLLTQTQNGLKSVANAEKDVARENQTISRSNTLYSEMEGWLKKNVKAARVYGNEVRQLMSTLQNNKDPEALKRAALRFEEIDAAADAAGLKTATFFQRVKNIASMATGLWSTYQIIMKCVTYTKKMIQETIALDSAMGQLQIVTKSTNAEMSMFYNNLSNTAKEIGASMTDLTDSATTFARLGYSMNESSMLAKYTSMLKNVGDIDVGDAQNAMTALIKAYDLDVKDIETVMDKMVEVGNNFPISVSEIATGVNNAGSMLAAAGNTYEQTIAMLTAANTTVQDISKSSTGLRTIAARIRKTKTELDDLGEAMTEAEYDDLVNALTKYNVKITDVNGEFRSTYDIIKDIAAIWDTLDSKSQAALTEKLAGKLVPEYAETHMWNTSNCR